jgi:NAD(P)-dependent dehydrogenase (short-subunit alcohol dehydrogenase family)
VRSRPAGGAFLAISSGAGRNPTAGWAPYAASKAAVDALCLSFAEEEADAGLRVVAVAPGVIDTAMQAGIRASTPEAFPRHARFVEMKANDEYNSPAYIADHLLRLAFAPEPGDDDVLVRLEAER